MSIRRGRTKTYVHRPFLAGLLLLIVGLFGYIFDAPWLFPSQGPTAYILADRPDSEAARFHNIVLGHLFAIIVSFTVVRGLLLVSTVQLRHNLLWQAFSAAVSLTFLLMVMSLFRCTHPPAAATMLIIALGNFAPTMYTAVHFMLGVLTLACAGEGVKWLMKDRALPGKAG